MNPKELGKIVEEKRRAQNMSQEKLAAAAGTGQSTIDRIEKGLFKRTPSAIHAIFRVLKLPIDQIDTATRNPRTLTTPEELNLGARNLPVYASTQAGGGALIVSTDPIDFVRRPAPLEQVKDSYGIIIVGDSMTPEFKPGDVALIHPYLPPVRDESCVFYSDDGHGDVKATIKSFVRETETHWHVEQWNPPKKFALAKSEWQKAHRVVGKYSRR